MSPYKTVAMHMVGATMQLPMGLYLGFAVLRLEKG